MGTSLSLARVARVTRRAPGARMALGLLGVLVGLTACEEHSSHSTSTTTSFTIVEVESNDTALTANIAGSLYIGDRYTIYGHTTDDGSDPFDGFAFFPEQSLQLQVNLFVDDPLAVLELCLVDPFGPMPPLCWNTGGGPGAAFVVIPPGQELHLVISSLWSSSSYRLEVDGYPPSYGPATSGFSAEAGGGQGLDAYLDGGAPAVAVGEALESEGAEGRLILVDSAGEVHSFSLGVDARGPYVEVPRSAPRSARLSARLSD